MTLAPCAPTTLADSGLRGAQRSEMQMLVGQIFSSVPNSKRDVGSPEAAGRGTRTELSAMWA
jgi:hypothetical protein